MNRSGGTGWAAAALLALTIMTAACGTEGAEPVAPDKAAAEALPDLSQARPQGRPLVTVFDGHGSKIALDRSTLSTLPRANHVVFEPFIKKEVRFTGVYLWDLLVAAGLGDVKDFHFLALDDYQVELSAEQIKRSDALLATSHEGQKIELADGGPVRVVFPTSSPEQNNTDLWIWSVSEISAR